MREKEKESSEGGEDAEGKVEGEKCGDRDGEASDEPKITIKDEPKITRETIIEHLEELRRRLIPPIIIFFLVFAISLPFSKRLLQIFLTPFEGAVSHFIFTKPFESFWVHVKICTYLALFFAVPFFLWQMWLFVSPALYPHERKLARAVIISIIILFVLGASFGYFVVLPRSLSFLINTFSYDKIQAFINISDFLSFATKFSLAFGLSFQTPIVVVILVRMGLVELNTLMKFRPYAIVLSFVIAAIITPTPDALTQTALAIPLIILWEAGILASKIINKLI